MVNQFNFYGQKPAKISDASQRRTPGEDSRVNAFFAFGSDQNIADNADSGVRATIGDPCMFGWGDQDFCFKTNLAYGHQPKKGNIYTNEHSPPG